MTINLTTTLATSFQSMEISLGEPSSTSGQQGLGMFVPLWPNGVRQIDADRLTVNLQAKGGPLLRGRSGVKLAATLYRFRGGRPLTYCMEMSLIFLFAYSTSNGYSRKKRGVGQQSGHGVALHCRPTVKAGC